MMTINKHNIKRKFLEDSVINAPKRKGEVCGDYTICDRTPECTTLILCDGMGSGVKANIAAIMCASRIKHLLQSGLSLYQCCHNVIETMHRARTEDIPFSAFSAARIMCNGQYTVITFEMPAPVLIQSNLAYAAVQRFFTMGHEVVGEATGVLENGDSLVLVSDGVSQAGLGSRFSLGWTIDGFISFLNRHLISGSKLDDIPSQALNEIYSLSGKSYGDDVTITVLKCREAKTINILSGPPALKAQDTIFVSDFIREDGLKAVCGSSTADMVSRCIGKRVVMDKICRSFHQPPSYSMEGIDIVTEGVVTLNQLYNVLGENPDSFDENNCVLDLCRLILSSDIVRFFVGRAINPGHSSIVFKQMGIIPRNSIIPLITEKLKSMGKLVVVYER